jgi:D-arabinose 1-dehydrogenase-like Zn-dependent alcohol dehydrogenase
MYRRIECDGLGSISLRECAESELGPGTVRLSVSYCSVNRGDLERIIGSYGGIDVSGMSLYRSNDGRFVPGYEPSGKVVEIAADVDRSLLGRSVVLHSHQSCGKCRYCVAGADNLCGKVQVFGVATPDLGGWSEEIVVPAVQLLPLRDGVDLTGACTYEVTYGTALHSLRTGLASAELQGPVAVRGVPGALAVAACQFSVSMGLPCVAIVRDPTSDRVRHFRELLPDVAVVSEGQGRPGVLEMLGAPPAVVFEPLGGRYLNLDVDLVARGGVVGVVGAHLGVLSTVRADQLFFKGVSIHGTPRAPLPVMIEVAEMVAAGVVVPVIDRVFPMEDAQSALEYCANPTGIGRVLLAMG